MIDRIQCSFAVAQSVEGKVQIRIEQAAPGLRDIRQSTLSLELREEFSEAPARYLAELLNKHVSSISLSRPSACFVRTSGTAVIGTPIAPVAVIEHWSFTFFPDGSVRFADLGGGSHSGRPSIGAPLSCARG